MRLPDGWMEAWSTPKQRGAGQHLGDPGVHLVLCTDISRRRGPGGDGTGSWTEDFGSMTLRKVLWMSLFVYMCKLTKGSGTPLDVSAYEMTGVFCSLPASGATYWII